MYNTFRASHPNLFGNDDPEGDVIIGTIVNHKKHWRLGFVEGEVVERVPHWDNQYIVKYTDGSKKTLSLADVEKFRKEFQYYRTVLYPDYYSWKCQDALAQQQV